MNEFRSGKYIKLFILIVLIVFQLHMVFMSMDSRLYMLKDKYRSTFFKVIEENIEEKCEDYKELLVNANISEFIGDDNKIKDVIKLKKTLETLNNIPDLSTGMYVALENGDIYKYEEGKFSIAIESLTDKEWYESTIKKNNFTITCENASGEKELYFSLPLYNSEGNIIGVVSKKVSVAKFESFINFFEYEKMFFYVTLSDESGNIIINTYDEYIGFDTETLEKSKSDMDVMRKRISVDEWILELCFDSKAISRGYYLGRLNIVVLLMIIIILAIFRINIYENYKYRRYCNGAIIFVILIILYINYNLFLSQYNKLYVINKEFINENYDNKIEFDKYLDKNMLNYLSNLITSDESNLTAADTLEGKISQVIYIGSTMWSELSKYVATSDNFISNIEGDIDMVTIQGYLDKYSVEDGIISFQCLNARGEVVNRNIIIVLEPTSGKKVLIGYDVNLNIYVMSNIREMLSIEKYDKAYIIMNKDGKIHNYEIEYKLLPNMTYNYIEELEEVNIENELSKNIIDNVLALDNPYNYNMSKVNMGNIFYKKIGIDDTFLVVYTKGAENKFIIYKTFDMCIYVIMIVCIMILINIYEKYEIGKRRDEFLQSITLHGNY